MWVDAGNVRLDGTTTFLNASGAVLDFNNGDTTITDGTDVLTVAGGGIKLAAGTTTIAPLSFTVGTNLTTSGDGDWEMDADVFYGTTDAGNRGIIPPRQFIRAASAQTLTDTTNAQNLFDSPTNGQITLETGAYQFELLFELTSMSATSGNAQVLFGGTATVGGWIWNLQGLDNSVPTTIADDDSVFLVTNASAASAVTVGTGTAMRIYAKGTFEVTVAGTLIPQVDLVTGGVTPTLVEGSFFNLERIGATGTASVGQWD